jgi:small subunit ribosomal protein S9
MTPSGKYIYANGKRKSAVARVRVYEQGTGDIFVNEEKAFDWCDTKEEYEKLISPLKLTGQSGKFTITIKVIGGGKVAQSEACRHGIAKAIQEMDTALRTTLKKAGYLTRDSRVKERKKFGLKRARRAEQFSKR